MPNEFIVKNGLISQGNITISGSITATGGVTVSGSIASASYASNAELLDGLDSTVFTLTSSFNAQTASFTAFTSSMNSFSASILTNVTALNAKTASFATTGSNTFVGAEVISGSLAISGSGTPFTLNTDTLEITGSLLVTGSTTLTGSLLQLGNFTTTGTIIAQTINVQTVTSSIVYSSGSNVFGNSLGNSQTFTGSVLITGSLTIAGASSATSYNGATIFGSTIACSPIGCFATSCATSFIGGTMSGTTIYGSTAVCSAVGKFTSCIDITSAATTGTALRINGDNLTTGTALSIVSNDGSASHTGNLVEICNAFNAGAAAKLMCLYQGDDGDGIYINMARGGVGLTVDGAGGGYSAIFNNGNVGIGTISPEGKLTIQGTSAQPPTSGTTANSLLQLVGSLNNQLNIGSNTVNGDYGSYIQSSDNNLAVPYPLNLQPNGGNVGIGTSSPLTSLQIAKSGGGEIALSNDVTGTYPSAMVTGFLKFYGAPAISDYFSGIRGYRVGYANQMELDFFVGPGNIQAMKMTTSGNVGIGTITPSDLLHVEKCQAGGMGMIIRNSCGATSNTSMCSLISLQLVGVGQTGQLGVNLIAGKEGDYSSAGVRNAFFAIQTACGDNLYERLRITSTGNVGISTTVGTAALGIGGNDAQTTANLTDAGTRKGILEIIPVGGAAGYGGALVLGSDTWGTGAGKGQIALKAMLTDGSGCGVSDLAFSLRNNSACSNLTERMRITSGGSTCFYGTVLSTAPSNGYNFRGLGFSTGAIATGGSCLIYSSLDRGLYLISIASSVTSTFGYSAFLWVDSSNIAVSSVIRQECVTISTSGRALCVVNQFTSETATMTITTLNLLNYIG